MPLDELWVYDPTTGAWQRADTLDVHELAAAWRAGLQLLNEDEFKALIAERFRVLLEREAAEAARWN